MRDFFSQATIVLPDVYADAVKRDLGPLWPWLPAGALRHDHHAYLAAHERSGLGPAPSPSLAPAAAATPRASAVTG